MPPARCDACVIRGGAVIADEADLKTFRKLLEGEPQDGMDIESLSVGDYLSMPPCVSEQDLADFRAIDQPCPRAELSEENELPWELVRFSLDERTRPCVGPILDSLPEEHRARVALRVALTLKDHKVNEELDRISREAAEKRAQEQRERAQREQ